MNRSHLPLLAAATSVLFAACGSPQISSRPLSASEPAAQRLLGQSQQAHGAAAFSRLREVTVRYDGKWSSIGPRFQPVLADTSFRRGSAERLTLRPRTLAQDHTGPAGKKTVDRDVQTVRVRYNGQPSTDPEVRQAAALVADAYTMFLLGPFYFDRPGVRLAMEDRETVDGRDCDRVLAVLRPGFGESVEDRVLLSIDRADRRLRRVRMTLNGLESTQGAEVDVTFRDFKKIDGVWWPTDFDERIRVPFQLHAHHWRMLDLKAR